MTNETIHKLPNEKEIAFSVCIPVYNCDVSELVNEIHRQAVSLAYPFEILLIDDYSTHYKEKNRNLKTLAGVSYNELNKNTGRSMIRNLLAEQAQYSLLIFMDCDTKIENPKYIQNYLNEYKSNVVIGGYGYSTTPPDKKYLLRWYYGKKREERSAIERNKNPNKSFSTFNFMIRKDIFSKIKFDETISGYGHEDTLFGWNLKRQGIFVKHIDNPIIHESLDETEEYIRKTENSILNLLLISQNISNKKEFIQDIFLLKTYCILKKFHLTALFLLFFYSFKKFLYRNLCSKNPKLIFFDIYKLGILNKESKNIYWK